MLTNKRKFIANVFSIEEYRNPLILFVTWLWSICDWNIEQIIRAENWLRFYCNRSSEPYVCFYDSYQ